MNVRDSGARNFPSTIAEARPSKCTCPLTAPRDARKKRPVAARSNKGSESKPKAPDEEATPSEASEEYPDVGKHLRQLRDQRGWSLETLAQTAGVSRAMLGQIELGQSVPTIKTVWRIARALEVPFSALLGTSEDTNVTVLRAGASKVLASADGSFSSRALFPFGSPRKVEFYELRLAAKGVELAEPHAPGTVEHLAVTKGAVRIVVDGRNFDLEHGDSIVFDADRPHEYRSRSAGESVMYLVMSYAAPTS